MARKALSEIARLDGGKLSNRSRSRNKVNQPRCGLCGKTKNLTKTDCCDNWICDDESNYQLFSFAHTSCIRNHRRYTLCGGHHTAGHEGRWQNCETCRGDFETEMYVYFGTNEHNFEKLKNPPRYEPTRCVGCKKIIRLGYDGYSYGSEGYSCEKCSRKEFSDIPDF